MNERTTSMTAGVMSSLVLISSARQSRVTDERDQYCNNQ